MTKYKHAKAIGDILKKFAKDLGIVEAYFSINSVTVHQSCPGKVSFGLGSHPNMKKKTLGEIDNLKFDLYKQIQQYLIKHKLQTDVMIDTIYYSWAVSGWRISFVESYEVP